VLILIFSLIAIYVAGRLTTSRDERGKRGARA